MKKKTQRIVVIVLAAVMLLSVLVPAMSVMAGAITQSDIDEIKNNLNDITNQKESIESQLAAIKEDKSQAEAQIALVQEQIVLTEQQISQSQDLLDQYDQQIQEKEAEITQLEAQEAAQYEEFYAQTRWMEESGGVSYLSILFQASSFSEMLDYAMLISDIMDYSNGIITDLRQTQAEIAQVRDELQTSRDEQAAVQLELESQKAELDVRKSEATTLLNQIASMESEYSQRARDLAAAEAEVAAELERAEAEYEDQLNNIHNDGTWYWPLPGRYYISSVFGGRYSPITGKWETHTGTDVPAPGGTEIHAAAAGVVTTAKYNVSYGNYCIISHGNGYATLYAHMRSLPVVSVGQTVEKGQVIGYVGSTGDSTGNHLHFELRINGNRADALDLYPNLSFTGL